MDEISTKKVIQHIDPVSSGAKPRTTPASPKGGPDSFGAVLKGKIQEINQLQLQADKAIEGVMVNNTQSVHEAVIALEKANVSFRTMMEVRNKIVEAYQEIMRMQV